jgi:hypothetical protein
VRTPHPKQYGHTGFSPLLGAPRPPPLKHSHTVAVANASGTTMLVRGTEPPDAAFQYWVEAEWVHAEAPAARNRRAMTRAIFFLVFGLERGA